MSIHRMELLTCADYGCPGCQLRHFYRTTDRSKLTEVPDVGMFTPERLAVLGRVALITGAVQREAPADHGAPA